MYCSQQDIGTLIRQVTRWLYAAKQDQDPAVKFLHASYGVGNLDAIRQIISDSEIKSATGLDSISLMRELSMLQDQAQKEIGYHA